jgi:hypothetical protein
MTSKDIYTSEKALPYVYRLDYPVTGEFYIGYREANKRPSHLDLPEYRTSAPKVTNTFDLFEWKILAEFYDGDDAYDHEQLLIYENWDNPLLLNGNCHYGSIKRFKFYNHTEEHKIKIGNIHRNKINSEETKKRISDSCSGFVMLKDKEGVFIRLETTDERCFSEEFVGPNKNKITVKDIYGNTFQTDITDPRFISGELVGATKGKKLVWKKKREQVTCSHCNKIGDVSGMSRWHGDYCKLKL